MVVSEKEAVTKQCRVGGLIEVGKEKRFPLCIASRCMHWQPVTLALAATRGPTGRTITEAQPGTGYCGLSRQFRSGA